MTCETWLRSTSDDQDALASQGTFGGGVERHRGIGQRRTTLNVNWGDGCGKATCFDDNGVHTQTFSAKDFGGPVTIAQLLMQRGVPGELDTSTFRISFQLNGQDVGTWGQYNMGGIGGDQLTFSGENFVWNPEVGDLVLILAITPPLNGGGFSGSFNALEDGSDSSEPFNGPVSNPDPDEDDPPAGRQTLVTTAVPEPATWDLMIGGFGMVGALLRRRELVVSAQPKR